LSTASTAEPDSSVWAEGIFHCLQRARIRQVAYVPDAGHAHLIDRCLGEESMRCVPLTTEEEGVALVAGAWLGGERSVLLMQSSGVGNCINMLSLVEECRFPFLTLVTMRGEWGEFNPWQLPMGQGTPAALASVGVITQPVHEAERVVDTVESALGLVYGAYRAVAVLISQRVIGAKAFQ
jgi:sulfopyruvate decarboxylase alpha subunit